MTITRFCWLRTPDAGGRGRRSSTELCAFLNWREGRQRRQVARRSIRTSRTRTTRAPAAAERQDDRKQSADRFSRGLGRGTLSPGVCRADRNAHKLGRRLPRSREDPIRQRHVAAGARHVGDPPDRESLALAFGGANGRQHEVRHGVRSRRDRRLARGRDAVDSPARGRARERSLDFLALGTPLRVKLGVDPTDARLI